MFEGLGILYGAGGVVTAIALIAQDKMDLDEMVAACIFWPVTLTIWLSKGTWKALRRGLSK